MSTSSGAPETWISSFCSLLGHEYFAEVSEDFIEDDFNLTGLQSQVPSYKEALEMILDVEPEEDVDEEEEEEEEENETGEERMRPAERRQHTRMPSDLSLIEGSAELLYGLIHQRFICSRAGIQQMSEKYELSHFGVCPRTYCNLARTLPVGLSDIPGEDTVKLFCPSCLDVYVPPNSRFQTVDGAFFGRTFGSLFLLTFPEYDLTKNGVEALTNIVHAEGSGSGPAVINGIYAANTAPGLGRGKIFEPKIYGFRVSELSRSGPRMQWLRDKPDDLNVLNEAKQAEERAAAAAAAAEAEAAAVKAAAAAAAAAEAEAAAAAAKAAAAAAPPATKDNADDKANPDAAQQRRQRPTGGSTRRRRSSSSTRRRRRSSSTTRRPQLREPPSQPPAKAQAPPQQAPDASPSQSNLALGENRQQNGSPMTLDANGNEV